MVQVNLCQKPLFLNQLTHNMTTDCSLFMKSISSEYLQNILCTQIVGFVLFCFDKQNNFGAQHVLQMLPTSEKDLPVSHKQFTVLCEYDS
jgi:penicillin-binding protein-related factor A (putative recombinase)